MATYQRFNGPDEDRTPTEFCPGKKCGTRWTVGTNYMVCATCLEEGCAECLTACECCCDITHPAHLVSVEGMKCCPTCVREIAKDRADTELMEKANAAETGVSA